MWVRGMAIAVVACAVLATAPIADPHPGHGAVWVSVGGFKYAPSEVSVYAGDSVLWTWGGPDTNHSVTADPGQPMDFDSDAGKPSGEVVHPLNDGYGVSFTQVGSFTYHCKVHSFMTGKVTVQPPPGGTPQAPAAPRLTKASVKPKRFCTRCPQPGTTVRFNLDGPASVRASLLRHGKSVKEIDFDAPPGPGTKRLKFKKVPNGSYILRLVAVDNVSGLKSKPADSAVEVRG